MCKHLQAYVVNRLSSFITELRAVSSFQDRCMGNDWWAQNRYCEKRCFAAGNSYGINCSSDGDYREDHVCGYEEELVPFSEAEKNCKGIGMNICDRTRVW